MNESESSNSMSEVPSQKGPDDEMSVDLGEVSGRTDQADSNGPLGESQICMSQSDILAMTSTSNRRLSQLTIQSNVDEPSSEKEAKGGLQSGLMLAPAQHRDSSSMGSRSKRLGDVDISASTSPMNPSREPGAVAVGGIDGVDHSGYASIAVPMAAGSSRFNIGDDEVSDSHGPFGSRHKTRQDEGSSRELKASVVKAQALSNQELEEEIITRYMQRATPSASVIVVPQTSPNSADLDNNKDRNLPTCCQNSSKGRTLISILSVVILLIGCGMIVGTVLYGRDGSSSTNSDVNDSILSGMPTLEIIQDRGYIKCRGDPDELNQGYGFSIDMVSRAFCFFC